MQKQRKTLNLIISGRYSRNSDIQNQQQQPSVIHNQHSLSNSRSKQKQIYYHIESANRILYKDKKRQQFKHEKNKDVDKEQYKKQKIKQQKQIKKIISDKYKTFMKWDFRNSLPQNIRMSQTSNRGKQPLKLQNNSSIANFSILIKKQKSPKLKKTYPYKPNSQIKQPINLQSVLPQPTTIHQQKSIQLTPQMQAIRLSRRQRFIKLPNPIQFLKHYIQKQNYVPTLQQKHLIQKLIAVQKSLQNQLLTSSQSNNKFQEILQNIYKLMNLTVDYNQLVFLGLLVCLAGDLCYYIKDYARSFYFYNQTRIAGSYAHLDKLKIPALIGIGQICFALQYYQQSKRLFRKALQYCWRIGDQDTQLQIYDFFGQISNQIGKVRQSYYYHQKFAKNILQPQSSALKKISKQMLIDYDKHVESLQDTNLDSLFLEYIHLPINNRYEVKQKSMKKYKNYNQIGSSPRMEKQYYDFSRQNFPDFKTQLNYLLQNDYEFKMEIADPDKPGSRQLNRLFNKSLNNMNSQNKKRSIDFQHSIEYNRIINKKPQKPNVEKALKKPLQQKVQQMLKQKLDPKWYQIMVSEIKKRRMQKVGALKSRIRNSHLSYGKYPTQRKRQVIWSTYKINQSFNRTLLDWIDPIQ